MNPSANNCVSFHPDETPLWLFRAAEVRECVVCTLSIIADDCSSYPARKVAVRKLRTIFEQCQSLDVLCQHPPGALVDRLLVVLRSCGCEAELMTSFIDAIVHVAFACDSHLAGQDRPFRFVETLLVSAASQAAFTIPFVLLARTLKATPQRDSFDVGAFQVSAKNALTGNESRLLFKAADLLAPSEDTIVDVVCAAVDVCASVLSMGLVIDLQIIRQFAERIGSILNRGLVSDQGGKSQKLLSLILILLQYSSDSRSFANVETVLQSLNENDGWGHNGLMMLIKSALLSMDECSIDTATRIIQVGCSCNIKICSSFQADDIPDYLRDALKRFHGKDQQCGKWCKSAIRACDALRSVLIPQVIAEMGDLVISDCLKSVLHAASTCCMLDIERAAVPLLGNIFLHASENILSNEDFSKQFLTFVHKVILRFSRRPDATKEPQFAQVMECFLKFMGRCRLKDSLIDGLMGIVSIVLEVYGVSELLRGIVLALLVQVSRYDEVGDDTPQFRNVRDKILQLIYVSFAMHTAKEAANAVENNDDEDAAIRAVDFLEVVQHGFGCAFLFGAENRQVKITATTWCWNNIDLGSIFTIGKHFSSDARRSSIIKQYFSHLLGRSSSESDSIRMPITTEELADSIENTDCALQDNFAFQIVCQWLETPVAHRGEWLEGVVGALRKRITEESIVENEEDTVNSVVALFRISRHLPNFNSSNSIHLPDASWMILVRSRFYHVQAEPRLFVHFITEIHSTDVCAALLDKLTIQMWEATESFRKDAETFLSMDHTALGRVVEVILTRRVSADLLDLSLRVFSMYCETNAEAGASLLDQFHAFPRILKMLKTFKVKSTRDGRTKSQPFGVSDGYRSWEPFQTAGLLRISGELFLGTSNDLFSSCFSCIHTINVTYLLENPVLVLGILRYLVRSFETQKYPEKLLVHCARKIGPKLVKLLKQRSTAEPTELKCDDFTVTAGIATLLVLIVEYMKLLPLQFGEDRTEIIESLQMTGVDWANLCDCVAPVPAAYERSFSVTNCVTLLCLVVSNEQVLKRMQNVEVLMSALVSAASSSEIILINTALYCLYVMRINNPAPGWAIREEKLCEIIARKVARRHRLIYGAEVLYVSIYVENMTMELEMDTPISRIRTKNPLVKQMENAVEELKPTYETEYYGVRAQDLRVLKEKIMDYEGREEHAEMDDAGDEEMHHGRRLSVIYGNRVMGVIWK